MNLKSVQINEIPGNPAGAAKDVGKPAFKAPTGKKLLDFIGNSKNATGTRYLGARSLVAKPTAEKVKFLLEQTKRAEPALTGRIYLLLATHAASLSAASVYRKLKATAKPDAKLQFAATLISHLTRDNVYPVKSPAASKIVPINPELASAFTLRQLNGAALEKATGFSRKENLPSGFKTKNSFEILCGKNKYLVQASDQVGRIKESNMLAFVVSEWNDCPDGYSPKYYILSSPETGGKISLNGFSTTGKHCFGGSGKDGAKGVEFSFAALKTTFANIPLQLSGNIEPVSGKINLTQALSEGRLISSGKTLKRTPKRAVG